MTTIDVVTAYENVKVKPEDGSLAAAIRTHSQACGLVAYVFKVHPDRVGEAVKDKALKTRLNSRQL